MDTGTYMNITSPGQAVLPQSLQLMVVSLLTQTASQLLVPRLLFVSATASARLAASPGRVTTEHSIVLLFSGCSCFAVTFGVRHKEPTLPRESPGFLISSLTPLSGSFPSVIEISFCSQ